MTLGDYITADDVAEALADAEEGSDDAQQLADLLADMQASQLGELISEHAWQDYADDVADDIYGLEQSGACRYFEYEAFAEALQSDYTELDYDGTAYYGR